MHRQRLHVEGLSASAMLRHRGGMPDKGVHGLGTLRHSDAHSGGKSGDETVQGRTCRRSSRFASAGRGAGDAGFGRASNRMVNGFGRSQSPADVWVKAHSRGKPKGASGLCHAATRGVGNGLPAGQPLRWRRLSKSVQVSAGAQAGRRVNHERGWNTGERASNGAVTVPTSPGGKSSEGSVSVRMVGCRRRKVSALGLKPDKPHGR